MAAPDDLIARLRQRAADAGRRTDARPGTAVMGGQILDLGALLPGLFKTAPTDLARPVDAKTLARAEREIGRMLPAFLRRVYLEIADGGFGPGFGLLPIERVAKAYRALRDETPGPPGTAWPDALVPLVGDDAAYECVDTTTGAIVAYDAEELLEHWDPDEPDAAVAEEGWKACFSTSAPSVEAWLERWVTTPTATEQVASTMPTREALMEIHRRNMREAIARYAAMTPEQRRKHLSDADWERMQRTFAEDA